MVDEDKVTKQRCRNAWDAVFDKIGGEEHLEKWAKEHPTEFYRIFAKLVPPIKEDRDATATHDSFIKLIMLEHSQKQKQLGQPIQIIDVEIEENS